MVAIQDKNVKGLIESKVNDSFGLSVKQVANKCKGYGRFKAWLGGDVSKITAVLSKVKSAGVSPAFFASYEVTEGYNSKWGWLNHTSRKGTYTEDAVSVSKWLISASENMKGVPAWIDYANYKDFVPKSVQNEGNAHYKKLKSGSIGRVMISGTAAATWGVYYPNGLLASYNGIQNYANPFTTMAKTIVTWGGNFDGTGTTDPEPDPPPPPDEKDPAKPPKPTEPDLSDIMDKFTSFGQNIVKSIEEMLIVNLYDYGQSKTFGNEFVRVERTFDNVYKIKPTLNFDALIKKIIKKGLTGIKDDIGEVVPPKEEDNNPPEKPDPEPEPEPDPDPKPDKRYFPVKKGLAGINFFKRSMTSGYPKGMTYGMRDGGFHRGYDIGTNGHAGYGIYAVSSGTVTRSMADFGSGGWAITIKHNNDKYYSGYLHLLQGSQLVKKGDKVKAGQKIATMGRSGGAYPIHLHYELTTVDHYNTPDSINPETYLGITGNYKSSLPSPP